ncbi:FIG00841528: hypothetical protein [hydrothermal vent metagenome]|uniref:Uncharacterized protein n=1 Tax=hydrothermal vent metagenome TaxID=652676 RepID=A0A3B0YYJ5_9ZZZZ
MDYLSRFAAVALIPSMLVFLAGCGSSDTASTAPVSQPGEDDTVAFKFTTTAPSGFVAFESGQVRPMALSSDGKQLYALNTPDNRLEIFKVTATALVHQHSIPVGMEPVAVAARSNGEVWVVNHLSDSVSVIDTNSIPPRLSKTLLVGDEPRDIVFAGNGLNRAFITTAHRGQSSPYSPALMPDDPGEITKPGIGRADMWVFDANNTGSAPGGSTLSVLSYFTDTPRALAVSKDNNTVYLAGFHTGNKTTVIHSGAVCDGGVAAAACNPGGGAAAPGGLPAPNADKNGNSAPEESLIVKYNGNQWLDELNRNWSNQVKFKLPDTDVFAVDANTLSQKAAYTGVGTILFNMVANPVSGKVYVSNTDANNKVRFEGTRPAGSTTSTVVGNLHKARITVIDPGANTVQPRHLNKHIDYSVVPSPAGVKENSLAMPTEMVVSSDGATLYVAAYGSSKVGVFETQKLENNSFTPDSANHISVSGGGAGGLVLNEARNQLYVLTRFDNSISVIDTASNTEIRHYKLHNPEPQLIVNGRPFLYDANLTSSNGEVSCSSCHVFGDFDSLAWDLGDPQAEVVENLNVAGPLGGTQSPFHPMKGPMATQSLRGLANQGPMHWRGDRSAANSGGNAMDEFGAFKTFNVAFSALLGRDTPLSAIQMDAFTNFILQVTYPPNPNRPLDNSLTARQGNGSEFHSNALSTGNITCNACHVIEPENGLFGTSGFMSFENDTQEFKIPHLRNMYQKVGMFGFPNTDSMFATSATPDMGDQIRGFGFTHDGAVDTMDSFLKASVFSTSNNAIDRGNVEQFMHAMDTNMPPVIGQQVTLDASNSPEALARMQLITSQMDAGHNTVVVKGKIANVLRGWFRQNDGSYQSDDAFENPLSEAQLLQLASVAGQELTFTAVPPGTEVRMGVDRDNDLTLDLNDNCPGIANADQADSDNDGVGDACPSFCLADFDNDGDVDAADTAVLSADVGRIDCAIGEVCEADFDLDNDVDAADSAVFGGEFGRTDCPIN